MKKHAQLEQENDQIRQLLLAQEADYEVQLQTKERIHSAAIKSKDRYIEQLQEALVLARNARFAANSEALRTLQLVLFNEAEQDQNEVDVHADEHGEHADAVDESDAIIIPAHKRKRGARKPLPEELPRIEVIHDLGAEAKVCPHDGHALKFISDKVSEQLDIVPMKVQVIRHIRKQYACPCCQGKGDSFIKTAAKPKQAIEKSQASAGLLAYIATAKYADSLPLYRQSVILNRFGIDIDRSSMASWMIKCGQLVQPLINRLEEHLLSQAYIHMDETPVQVLNEAGKAAQSKSYMWVRSAGPPGSKAILFDYDPSRSSAVPKRLLADYHASLMVDGYAGYDGVCAEQGITRLGCWAHARRKFVEATKAGGKHKKSPKAEYALKLIAKLYGIEKQIKDEPADVRYKRRQQDSKALISKLRKWLDETRPRVAPKLALGKALYYLDHQWPRLITYIDDGRYPIDNNAVENAIRPFAIGRKNWLFSSSVQGAKASANLYSLIQTAKANGLEPYAYLRRILTDLPKIETYDDVDKLLPGNVKALI